MWEEKPTGMVDWTLQKQNQQRAVCNFEDMSEVGQRREKLPCFPESKTPQK